MLNKRFKINTFITYFANAIVMASGFVLMFIINKYAGVQTYGELAIIISTAGIIAALLTARSGEAVTKFFVREKTYGNLENAKFIVIIGFCVDFILGIFVFLFFYSLSDFIATKFLDRPILAWTVCIYGFITISTFIRGSVRGYFQSHEYFRVINFVQVLEAMLKIVFLLISFFILNQVNINYVVYSYIMASFIVTGFILIIFLTRFLKEFKGIKLVKNNLLLKEYFSFNMKTFISTSLKAGNNNLDNLILGYFTDSKTVGIYQTLKNILSPIKFISTPFNMMTYSKLTRLYSEEKYKEFKNLIKTISYKILMVSIPVTLLLIIFSENILDLMEIKIELLFLISILSIMSLKSLISLYLWWTRVFSLIVNPIYSINAAAFILVFNLTVTALFCSLFKLEGLIISLSISMFLLLIYWEIKLRIL